MESGRHSDANQCTTINENANSVHSDALACKSDTDPAILRNIQDVSYIYRQDVVKNKANGKIGLVTEVAGDSDSDSSSSSDDDVDDDDEGDENDDEGEKDDKDGLTGEDGIQSNGTVDNNAPESSDDNDDDRIPLTADHIRVIWVDDSESVEKTCDVTVIDRGFLHGDYVAAASDPAGQIGIVVDVSMNVDLLKPDGSVMRDVPSRDLLRIKDFNVGDHIVLGPWLGRIEDVFDNVTVLFDDGSVCKVMKADPLQVKPVGKNILEDGQFPYYPGQRVKASSSSVFKNSRWLSGSWKAHRVEGTVIKVTVGSVYIYWIASAGYGPDSATTPSEEQSPKHLKLLSCFAHTDWQLGDWCLPPSSMGSASILDKGPSKSGSRYSAKDEPEHIDSDIEVSTTPESTADDKLIEDNLEASLDKDTGIPEVPEGSSLSCNSMSGLKESSHDVRPLRKKIRKGLVRKDKKSRKKVEHFVRALQIINTKTKVDVAWQDGTIKRGLESTSLISIDTPADHDFVAEQYVVEKAADDNNDDVSIRHVGVVKSVNAKDRTACVRWLKPVARAEDPREFDKEEVVSVYELEGHPDYDYCYGDVVVRLSPVSLPSNIDCSPHSTEVGALENSALNESMHDEGTHQGIKNMETAFGDDIYNEFKDLSWVGNITGLSNGDIEVTWADGMVSTVGPQAIYVVGRDDDYSVAAGSYASDDGASWETVDDDNVETDDNGVEEHQTYSGKDTRSEPEDSIEAAENSESNGTLSAAFGFMTKIASGIFSRGQMLPGPSTVQFEGEDGLHHEELTLEPDTRSSSPNSDDIRCQLSKLAIDREEIHGSTGAPHIIDITSKIRELCSDPKFEGLGGNGIDAPDQLMPAFKGSDVDSPDQLMPAFKGFDIASDPSDHHFLGGQGPNNAGRKWLKKVHQDWDILQRNLPEGIYVRVYEDRMDLLRAVIVGAYGTPYQDGLFFFDFHLPPEYPDVPPTAYYHSGGWRVNPNLYEDGKVCLSLLNTWTGKGNEVWDPSTSSILQVLVSLQGLVLNAKPYFNEAGYDKQVGTAEGEKNSLSYNENTFLLNCKTMMHLIRKPPKDFGELVIKHFKKRGYYILKACDAYMKGQLIGTLREDASISSGGNADSNSVGFKLMLNKIVPRLYAALEGVGADCQEFKHLIISS